MKYIATVTMILLLLTGCKQEENGIPSYPINIVINLDDPTWFNLGAVGGWEYVSGGSQGLIVFRSGIDDFMAYERHCVYQPENECRVSVDSTGLFAEDIDCSGSKFNLFNGSVVEGPATLPMHSYPTIFSGNILQIVN